MCLTFLSTCCTAGESIKFSCWPALQTNRIEQEFRFLAQRDRDVFLKKNIFHSKIEKRTLNLQFEDKSKILNR